MAHLRNQISRRRFVEGAGVAGLGLLAGCAAGGTSRAPTSASPAEVATLRGPDRQAILEAGAKQEGQLLWYTSLIVNQVVRPLADEFTRRYPYVKVDHYRADSDALAERIMSEYQAQRYDVDVTDGSLGAVILKSAGLLSKFESPNTAPYTPETRDPESYWCASHVYFMTEGINTRLVARDAAPRTYEDLLDPKWKGQMAWATSPAAGAPMFIGSVLGTMGPDKGMAYLEQLSKQGIRNLNVSTRAVVDQMIAGEFPISLYIFNHHTVISANQGAPSDWIPLEPVPATLNAFALPKNAPHPHASMLFLDFIFSEDGQRVIQEAEYLPAHPQVPAKTPSLKPEQGHFRVQFLNPEDVLKANSDWVDVYRRLFLQPS